MFEFQSQIVEHKTLPLSRHDIATSQLLPESKITSLSVIQIFGRTDVGESVCLHVHEIHPKLYIATPNMQMSELEEWALVVALDLNSALQRENNSIMRPVVISVRLVQARYFYYFSALKRPFLEICLVHAFHLKQAASILQSKFEVFEAHIPFELQFMISANLFGMDSIKLETVSFRTNREKTSKSDIEIDASFQNIMNSNDIQKFQTIRDNASGLFPRGHVMPSVVSMMNSLNLDSSTQTAEERPIANPIDFNEKYRAKMSCFYENLDLSRDFEASTIAERLPRAFYTEKAPESWIPSQEQFSQVQTRLSSLFPTSTLSHPSSDPISVQDFVEENNVDLPDDFFTESVSTPICGDIVDMHPNFGQFDGPLDDVDDDDTSKISIYNMWSDNDLSEDTSLPLESSVSLLANSTVQKSCYLWSLPAPSWRSLELSLAMFDIPRKINSRVFVRDLKDSTDRGSLKVNRSFQIPVKEFNSLPSFFSDAQDEKINFLTDSYRVKALHYSLSYNEATEWLTIRNFDNSPPKKDNLPQQGLSQIEGPTQGAHFKFSGALQSQLSSNDKTIILSMEIFANSRRDLLSDPEHDGILAIFYSIYSPFQDFTFRNGIFTTQKISLKENTEVTLLSNEAELIDAFLQFVIRIDPEIICGYEIHKRSWGYLAARAYNIKNVSLSSTLSRVKEDGSRAENGQISFADAWSEKYTSSLQVYGRITLNVWRVMKTELSLQHHDFEFVAIHALHFSIPKYTQNQLLKMWNKDKNALVDYVMFRCKGNIDLLIQTETITRTSEFARLFGVNFYSVISRGSQFKVESLLLRLAHLENFLMLTPSKKHIVEMRAAESMPLVLEPESRLHVDPVVVLDFQALYPSTVIAYNYCYSTCIGSVLSPYPRNIGAAVVETIEAHGDTINSLIEEGLVTVSPNRIGFVKPEVREGILPKMLSELLDARVAVKGLLSDTTDGIMKKVLNARQLGVKYISNMTYGYTSAAFSGRMPSVDVADSIVQTGRLTLERAIAQIESHPSWKARVIYGDTDSLFVELKGRSLDDAFIIGKEIAKAVTDVNPAPVKLKFEKIYYPCALLAKKRYVGFKHEVPGQEPVFDAKGIETIRRDSCPLVSKILEKTIKILFRSKDLTLVKQYLQKQFIKILAGGHKNMADFIFSKEVKLGSYAADVKQVEDKKEGSDVDEEIAEGGYPPAAVVAKSLMRRDPMNVPEYGERVPFVVIYNKNTERLIDWVLTPVQMLQEPLNLHSVYYITKQVIPAVSRVLSLVGIDVNEWYMTLPKSVGNLPMIRGTNFVNRQTLDRFLFKATCLVCLSFCSNPSRICSKCLEDQQVTLLTVMCRIHDIESDMNRFTLASKIHCGCLTNPMITLDGQEYCVNIHCQFFWRHIILRHRDAPILQELYKVLEFLK